MKTYKELLESVSMNQQIRKELKKQFPKTKFNIRKTNIHWANGPTELDVKNFIDSKIKNGSEMYNFQQVYEEINEQSIPKRMVRDYEKRAKAERKAGGKIEINTRLPYISITMSDGSEYFFQEHEADRLLDEVPDNISAEDYILAIAQGW